jgi:hypothetical protein
VYGVAKRQVRRFDVYVLSLKTAHYKMKELATLQYCLCAAVGATSNHSHVFSFEHNDKSTEMHRM